jgi:hypothetical protein
MTPFEKGADILIPDFSILNSTPHPPAPPVHGKLQMLVALGGTPMPLWFALFGDAPFGEGMGWAGVAK